MNTTLNYYEINADTFASTTQNVDLDSAQERFLAYIPAVGRLLDFGCGAGRDTKAFLDKGYQVDAVDGSEELCRIAGEHTGISVRHMMFSELSAENLYDGIWACASILHLPREELKDVFTRMIRAIRNDGCIYTSFKYGEFEGYRGERYFTDFTEDSFGAYIRAFLELEIVDEWVSADARPGRGDEKWLNVILKKSDTI